MSPDDPRHGQYRGYRAHRVDGEEACEPCKRAAAGAEQRYVLARIEGKPLRYPAAGTQRRLRALQALGWTISEIAERLNEPRCRVEKWCSDVKTHVYASTAHRVAAVYDELCMTVPDGPWAERNRGMAARKGYAPPLAWENIDDPDETPFVSSDEATDEDVDLAVVERLLSLRSVPSTRAEKVEALRRWMATGRSQRSFCKVHGWQEGRYVAREAAEAVSA